ncbi:hypothetical protein EK21DRAFT_87799 [Setomelanomma holmii]|uniref:Uncharacterized protein n=1 Tax=Setomelanomma holmii TaxID=210430 RepID=A0A9P4HCX6_9PLEO|nr:hypothetical protein EK21DRAFT_87799 [Setomelanomma holmii]
MTTPSNSTTQYLPVPWTITSLDPSEHTCPSPSSLLGTFAAVNGIVSLLAVLFGHRRVVEELTCGYFGRHGSQSWKLLWVVPVGLQLAANACIALLIQRSDGYAANFKITELMLWLTARPRLSWIVLGAFAWKKHTSGSRYPHARPSRTMGVRSTSKFNVNTSYEELRTSPYASPNPSYISTTPSLHPSYTYTNNVNNSQRSLDNPYIHVPSSDHLSSSETDFLHDYPWWSAFMTQFIAEFVLQILALYIMGRTAHYGAVRNYYKIYLPSYWAIPEAARRMYSGALYYLVAGSLFLIFAFLFITWQMLSSKVKRMGKGNTVAIVVSLWFLLISTWLGSWLFWAGFVKLAGDLYCPPKLIQQGVIWTFFSAIGIMLGTGV